mmetsp:Transcript_71625/g.120008  ORF Transcript_71625/g.120008 Transcript_71625/m.120008 type:complete len:223 (+) Transcript_71625:1441-2109(+)
MCSEVCVPFRGEGHPGVLGFGLCVGCGSVQERGARPALFAGHSGLDDGGARVGSGAAAPGLLSAAVLGLQADRAWGAPTVLERRFGEAAGDDPRRDRREGAASHADVQQSHPGHELLPRGRHSPQSRLLPGRQLLAHGVECCVPGGPPHGVPGGGPHLLRVPRPLSRRGARRDPCHQVSEPGHAPAQCRDPVRGELQPGVHAAAQEQGHPRGRLQGDDPVGC